MNFPHLFRLLLLAFLTLEHANAGTFSTRQWTNDANSGIDSVTTQWAYTFGSSNSTVINSVPVSALPGVQPIELGSFRFLGSAATIPDVNNLTNGSDGSAVMASNFLFGGSNRTITLEGLRSGVTYSALIFCAGWEDAIGFRTSTFASGGDSMTFDQHTFGQQAGFIIEYEFEATGTTRDITIDHPTPSSPTFHIYGLALNKVPIVVTSKSDTAAASGTLRQTIDGASPGSLITFDPSFDQIPLSLQDINLVQFNYFIDKELTIDATRLSSDLDLNGGSQTQIIVASVNAAEIDITSSTGTTATLSTDAGNGNGALNAIDGNDNSYSESAFASNGTFLDINLNRDVTMASLELLNLPTGQPRDNLHDLQIELFDRDSNLLWKSGRLNPLNQDFFSPQGPDRVRVNFPPQRVHQFRISVGFSVTSQLSITEVKAYSPGLRLRGLTFKNGNISSQAGGAVSNNGSGLSIESCRFDRNEARLGGAINNTGQMSVSGCTFIRNATNSTTGDSSSLAADIGGAFFQAGDAVSVVEDCEFLLNVGNSGGGAFAAIGGEVTFARCTFEDNSTVGNGGAIHLRNTVMSMDECELLGNKAVFIESTPNSIERGGGGIFSYISDLTIEDSLISGNEFRFDLGGSFSSASGGGGLLVEFGVARIDRCRFEGNKAPSFPGGAIHGKGRVTATNSLFVGNSSSKGGAVATNSTFSGTNLTISGNRAFSGGAFYQDSGSSLTLLNTIVWNNVGGNSGDLFAPENSLDIPTFGSPPSSNIQRSLIQGFDSSSGFGNANGLLPSSAPLFAKPVEITVAPSQTIIDFQDSNLRLSAQSPYIDYPQSADFTPLDLEGNTRRLGSFVDLGATEFLDGTDEVLLIMETDADEDGVEAGVEAAIGSDPFVADFDHPNKLRISRTSPTLVSVEFGVDLAAQNEFILQLKRGNDLETITTILRNNSSNFFLTADQKWNEGAIEKRFFRLEAEPRTAP